MSVGSAINDTTRVAGGALGVAVLGSLLASGYRGDMESAVSALPGPVREIAQDSLAGGMAVAERLGDDRLAERGAGRVRVRHAHGGAGRGRAWRCSARSWPRCSCRAASGSRRGRPSLPEVRAPGRPRSVEADQAILQAALELLAENGYAALTMERVRERSGVGKATLYRRYGSKEELVRAAIVHLNSDIPMPEDTGSMVGDFAATAQVGPGRRRPDRRADADAAAAVRGRGQPGDARAVLRAPGRAAAARRARDRRAGEGARRGARGRGPRARRRPDGRARSSTA